MPKPPRELTKQIEILEKIIGNLNELISTDKIKMDLYGKDFQEPLTEIQQDGLALRGKLEVFKSNLEEALTEQYYSSERFASVNKVLDSFLYSTIYH